MPIKCSIKGCESTYGGKRKIQTTSFVRKEVSIIIPRGTHSSKSKVNHGKSSKSKCSFYVVSIGWICVSSWILSNMLTAKMLRNVIQCQKKIFPFFVIYCDLLDLLIYWVSTPRIIPIVHNSLQLLSDYLCVTNGLLL